MKIAVIGAGIFGCTAAIQAARKGHEVELFEQSEMICGAASAVNQFRLHLGYHYPRSPETGRDCRKSLNAFVAEYIGTLVNGHTVYAIADDGSRTSPSAFLKFCESEGLWFKAADLELENASIAVSVKEMRLDIEAMRKTIGAKLKDVKVHFKAKPTAKLRDQFDAIIVAAYANTNTVTSILGATVEPFQFEVCEKPVFRLSEDLADLSVVMMDGEFFSIDPMGSSGLHVMGHVKHAIHATNCGLYPEVPSWCQPLLNGGIIANPTVTNHGKMLESARRFLPVLEQAGYVGSMFTVRAVLPNRDMTDERPTLVDRLDEQVIRIFSGKIGTAVTAARTAIAILDNKDDLSRSAA